jgi:hypothetical protein
LCLVPLAYQEIDSAYRSSCCWRSTRSACCFHRGRNDILSLFLLMLVLGLLLRNTVGAAAVPQRARQAVTWFFAILHPVGRAARR